MASRGRQQVDAEGKARKARLSRKKCSGFKLATILFKSILSVNKVKFCFLSKKIEAVLLADKALCLPFALRLYEEIIEFLSAVIQEKKGQGSKPCPVRGIF